MEDQVDHFPQRITWEWDEGISIYGLAGGGRMGRESGIIKCVVFSISVREYQARERKEEKKERKQKKVYT